MPGPSRAEREGGVVKLTFLGHLMLLASKMTIYMAGSRGGHCPQIGPEAPATPGPQFSANLKFLVRGRRPSAGRENCGERRLGSAMGEGALVPLLLSRSRGLPSPAAPGLRPRAGGPADRSTGRRPLSRSASASRSNCNSPPPTPPSLRAPATFRPPPPA